MLITVGSGSGPRGVAQKKGWKAGGEVVLGMCLMVLLGGPHRQRYSCHQVLEALEGQPGKFQRLK